MVSHSVCYLLVCVVSLGLGTGIGIGIGYGAFQIKNKTTGCEQGVHPTDVTTPQSTTLMSNTSIPTTTMLSTPISTAPATLSSSTDSYTTTTTEQPPPVFCPPSLPEPTNSNILLSLDRTTGSTTFTKYSFSYDSPSDANTVMLIFEFTTVWGSWYLDDVSVTESGGDGSIGPEIIDNGGFETGNLGSKWNFCDPRYPWITAGAIVSHTSHSGSYSYESQDTSNGSDEFLTQKFSIKGNTRYTIEFYLSYNGDPTSAVVTLISH